MTKNKKAVAVKYRRFGILHDRVKKQYGPVELLKVVVEDFGLTSKRAHDFLDEFWLYIASIENQPIKNMKMQCNMTFQYIIRMQLAERDWGGAALTNSYRMKYIVLPSEALADAKAALPEASGHDPASTDGEPEADPGVSIAFPSPEREGEASDP